MYYVTINFQKGIIRFYLLLDTKELMHDEWYCDYAYNWGKWFRYSI